MPIYEEKLICPLSVRFTQDHIRSTFRDGREVEASASEIQARPGEGDYDVILEAPFPNIEIVRWYQRDTASGEPGAKHWFTLDNRRLYCLQRAAAALWPRRAAAVVEVLYAAPESIWRKNTSLTAGCSVAIGHNPDMATGHWCWQEAVSRPTPAGALATTEEGARGTERAPRELVSMDDEKDSIEALLAAPAPPSLLDLFLQSSGPNPVEVGLQKRPPSVKSEVSTRSDSTPRSSDGSDRSLDAPKEAVATPAMGQGRAAAALGTALCGRWQGKAGDVYSIQAVGSDSWACEHVDADGRRWKWALHYDGHSDAVWWGPKRSDYLDASEVRAQPGLLQWFGRGGGTAKGKPTYTWHKFQGGAGGAPARARVDTSEAPHRARGYRGKFPCKGRQPPKRAPQAGAALAPHQRSPP